MNEDEIAALESEWQTKVQDLNDQIGDLQDQLIRITDDYNDAESKRSDAVEALETLARQLTDLTSDERRPFQLNHRTETQTMNAYTRPDVSTPELAADLIEQELATGCLNANVLAPDCSVEQALRVLIAAVRAHKDAETRLWEYLGTETYICDRDASAWGFGTMGLDDFRLAREDDEFMQSIIEAVTGDGPAAPKVEPPVLHPAFQSVMDALSSLTIRGK